MEGRVIGRIWPQKESDPSQTGSEGSGFSDAPETVSVTEAKLSSLTPERIIHCSSQVVVAFSISCRYPSATTSNFSTSVLPAPLGRCSFPTFTCGAYLNPLVATLSMTKCEMKAVKPAAGDTQDKSCSRREECLSDATFGCTKWL